jgi:hypothetical protein
MMAHCRMENGTLILSRQLNPRDEVLDARVYIGFYFRTSDQTGARMGRQVARFVVKHALRD